MTTADVVRTYYELANAGDWDAWCELFTPDTTMDEQLAGHIEGRQTLRELVQGFPDTFATFANVPVHTVIDGEQAAVVSRITARTTGGEPIEASVCNYFRVTDDRIVYMTNVHDTVPFAPIIGEEAGR